jgi:hypothetical protein
MPIPGEGHEHIGKEQQNDGFQISLVGVGNWIIIRAAEQQLP